MEYLITLCLVLTETLSAIHFQDAFLCPRGDMRQRRAFSFLGLYLTFLVISFTFPNIHSLKIIAVGVVLFLFSEIFYQGPLWAHFFTTLAFYLLLYGMDMAAIYCNMVIRQTSVQSSFADPVSFLLMSFISKLLLYSFCFFFKKWRDWKRAEKVISLRDWVQFALFPATSLFTLTILTESANQQNISSLWLLLDAIGLVVANIVQLFLLDKLEQENAVRQDNLILQHQLKNEVSNAQALADAYADQRKLTHDFNNHLAALQTLAQAGETAQLEAYLQHLCQNALQNSPAISCGSPIVDAVLNQKYAEACRLDIPMELQIDRVDLLPMEPEDMVVLLSNLLDNALEACQKIGSQKKSIRLKLSVDVETALLAVANTVKEPVVIQNNQIRTTKPDPLGHGYGLRNIQSVLQKYGYSYTLSYEDGWFRFSTVFS